jgi:DNA-binding helix-hairpin-helix protein with protein kinase domain
MTPSLIDDAGRPIRLSKRIGKGGEGEVYSIEGSDNVVKYYTIQDGLRTRELKVRQMLAFDLATKTPLVAFPKSLVFDRAKRFAGFTMGKVSAHKPLHELYSPGARKAHFPQANYRFLVLTAANIARAVASANAAGCIIGDINHSGILVSHKATVTLIDADSFQIGNGSSLFHCLVGVPEYTPPELQGKTLSSIARTENHDAFGLAVAIFLLLFMGRHPFSGRYSGGDLPLEKAISDFRFAYSAKRSVRMSPPPGVPTLADFPPEVRDAFEVAFAPEGIRSRPTAREWIALLDALRDRLRVCSANSLHQYPPDAVNCPWCRMEKQFLVPLFLPHILLDADTAAPGGPVLGDIVAIWRAIESVRPPAVTPFATYSGPPLAPGDEVRNLSKRALTRKIGAWLSICFAIALAIYAPNAILLSFTLGGAAWYLLASKVGQTLELETSYKAIAKRLSDAEVVWNDFNSGKEFEDYRFVLKKKKSEYDALPKVLMDRLDRYSRDRRSLQLEQYLSQKLIRNYKLPRIGDGRRAVLLSYGIEAAADVTERALLNVPGFGPATAKPLLDWRRHLESRFVYNNQQTAADKSAMAVIHAEVAQKATQLQSELAMGPAKLAQLAEVIPKKQASNLPFIEMLLRQQAQLEANFRALGRVPPQIDRPSQAVAPQHTGGQIPSPATGAIQCPKCGGNMVVRLARRGHNRGHRFYGCLKYPACNGTRPFP